MAYDIFISYRRDGGGSDARMMYDRLKQAGFNVSFDMDTLKNGNFNEELLKRIAECKNFIVLLSTGCFERTLSGCKRENDWLRIEIAAALYNRKNIIAVMLPGFTFPDKLPPDIVEIKKKNGPKYDLYYIDGFYNKLIEDFIIKDELPANEMISKVESYLTDVPELSESETDILSVIGDDSDFVRMETCKRYESLSRLIPFTELDFLDSKWNEAEQKRSQGNYKDASSLYLKVIDLCNNATPCYSAFVLRMTADEIDTRKSDWFAKALGHAQKGDIDYEYGVGTIYAEGLGIPKNTAAAFRWFERAALHGHPQAMGTIGAAYLSGNGVEPDYSAAKKWLKKASDKEVPAALERLAFLYHKGLEVKQNFVKAKDFYEKAAELGNSAACAALGKMYLYGDGVEADRDCAITYFRRAAADDHSEALRILAELKFSEHSAENDYVEALSFCRRAIDNDDIEAICLLGQAYENGWGVEKDLKKAGELYEKAKSSGSTSAVQRLEEMLPETQYWLGIKYMEGKEAPQDFVLARHWFFKAADQGHVDAMAWYGYLLRLGAGGKIDNETALSFFEKAAEGGSAVAFVELGQFFNFGKVVKKDRIKAKECYEKAVCLWEKVPPECKWNAVAAFTHLGNLYQIGKDCPKDILLAARLYRFAAQDGSIAGCRNLGILYRDGEGVIQDHKEMERWFSEMWQLAENIHPCHGAAMCSLGLACQSGQGCARDLKAAAYWWHKGMEQLDFSSMVHLSNTGREHPEIMDADDQVKVFDFYRKAAEAGIRIAMNNIAIRYRYGRGVAADSRIAAEWFLKSAELGYSGAMRVLGSMYESGDGVELDKEKGLEWIIKAAEADDISAQRILATRYRGGTSLGRDLTKSVEWLEKSLKNDPKNVYSLRMMATAYRDGLGVEENSTRARELYASTIGTISRLAEDQKAGSQDALADSYYRGWGVDVDKVKALELYEKAAVGKNEHAMAQLQHFYHFGVGMEPNREISDRWAKSFLDAKLRDGGDAARGEPQACVSIGNYYRKGYGIARDIKQAVIEFEKAAEKKSWEAMLILFKIFNHEKDCEQDFEKAEYWIQKALAELTSLAENGLADAQRALADCYAKGWGVEKSAESAVKWYSEAYAGGNWLAAARLAEHYITGEGVEQDEVKALELLNRAETRNSGVAKNHLGECYENAELGVSRDHTRAFDLYRSAAEEGNTGGLYNTGRCYAYGIGCDKNLNKAVMWLNLAVSEFDDFYNYDKKADELLKQLQQQESK